MWLRVTNCAALSCTTGTLSLREKRSGYIGVHIPYGYAHQVPAFFKCLLMHDKATQFCNLNVRFASFQYTAFIFSLYIPCTNCENIMIYPKSISECFILETPRVHLDHKAVYFHVLNLL